MYYTWLHDDPNDCIEIVTSEDIVQHRLIPITIDYSQNDNVYSFKGGEGYCNGNFKCSDAQLRKLLYRIKAKDSITLPASRKKVTYSNIIDGIKTKKYSQIFAWKSKTPTTLEELLGIIA